MSRMTFGVRRMEIRDVVRIKKGAGGLDPPENLCILLDREKDGKDHYAVVHTLKGRMRLKWDFLKETTGAVYSGDKTDAPSMGALLRSEIMRLSSGSALRLDPQIIIDTLKASDLWRSTLSLLASKSISETEDPPALSAEEIARTHYDPLIPDRRHVKAVEKVLSKADGEDRPYFMGSARNDGTYIPCSEPSLKRMEGHARRLEELKGAYVEWVQEDIDGKPVISPSSTVEDISKVVLNGDLKDELDMVCLWGLAYLENGSWIRKGAPVQHMQDAIAPPVGLGGTTARRLDGFDLERFLAFFFKDLPLSRSDDLPSNVLLTLLKLGRITWRTCSDLVVHHKIATGARRSHREFSKTVLAASQRIPDIEDDPRKGSRRDLRDLETYTIDPDDAKDFDDAVSLVPSKEGATVYVHIADVTHYVRPDEPVDSEARFRATSVYLPSGVLPMLPPRLSEDLCSLRESEDRLAMTARIRLDPDHNVIDSEFFPSVIKVRRNLTYDMVDGAIEEGAEPFATLYAITESLSASVRRMGLETHERKVRFVTDDEIMTTLKRPTRSTRMIEELMVLTNERAAEFLASNGAPCVYRVHPIPDVASVERFNSACDVLGAPIRIDGHWTSNISKGEGDPDADEDSMLKALLSGGKLSFGSLEGRARTGPIDVRAPVEVDRENMDAALDAVNEALSKVRALPEEWMQDLLSFTLLRNMPKAQYSLDNIGHFGLRSARYCHFTSPIRRYADVLVHRAMKALLSSEGVDTDATWEMPEREVLDPLTEHINDMSRSAEEWERQMVDVALSIRFAMSGTSSLWGRITSISPGACYVSLDEGMVEGRMSYRNMSRFRVAPDEDMCRIQLSLEDNMGSDLDGRMMEEVAREGGVITLFRLGGRIQCRIRSISISEGSIELTLA